MALYLIKSGLCLALVLGTYHLLFEDKKMHQFNRWFLLVGLAFACLVPLLETSFAIDFSQYLNQADLVVDNKLGAEEIYLVSTNTSQPIETTSAPYPIFMIIGFLISSLLFMRFCYNVTTLIRKAFLHEQIDYMGVKLVLLKEKILPHTFGKYIFINESDYRNKKIEDELFTHELTHAKQWHSVDIVLIEALQILFWMNPLLFFYKRAIQLNHEFLADDQVVKSHRRVRDYQELLLDKASGAKVYLASNLNFSVTKKRLTMMTKKTSYRTSFIFAFATIPLFFCLLMFFSCSKNNSPQLEELSKNEQLELKEDYFKNTTIVRKNKEGQKIYKPYADMTAKEKSSIPPPPPHPFKETLEPLPVGTLLELEADGKVLLKNNGDVLAPPPPPGAPHPPKAPKDLASPASELAPSPPAPPAYESLPPIEVPEMTEIADLIKYFKELIDGGAATFHLESGKEISGEKVLELMNEMENGEGGFSFTARQGKGVEIHFQGLD